MGGRAKVLQLLPSENINRDKMDLSMPVLAGLGSTHFNNFARAAFDHNEAVLPQCRTLHGVSGRCTSIGTVESVFMLREFVVSEWNS